MGFLDGEPSSRVGDVPENAWGMTRTHGRSPNDTIVSTGKHRSLPSKQTD
jgi:hypothetical protein